MLVCQFCSKECKNQNSLRNHERLCKLNPDRQYTLFADSDFMKNRKWTNQYTKAKALGLPKPTISEHTRKKYSDGNKKRSSEFTKNIGKKISKTVRNKVIEGSWHTSLAKKMHYDYNGADLHGKWKVAFAKFLDKEGVSWIRCRESFPYFFEGVQKRYTPDFYLPETDEYIEIKGFKTAKDEAKWSQFPIDKILVVYYGKHLKELRLDI